MTVKLQQQQQQQKREHEQEKQLQMIFICAKNCQINPMNGRAELPVISGYLLPMPRPDKWEGGTLIL